MIVRADALADTSAFIAIEQGRPLQGYLPALLAVSYVTIAELTSGVLHSPTPAEQRRRLRTLQRARELGPLPVDRQVATAWAELR